MSSLHESDQEYEIIDTGRVSTKVGTIASAAQELRVAQAPSTLNFIALFRRVDYEAATPVRTVGPRAGLLSEVTASASHGVSSRVALIDYHYYKLPSPLVLVQNASAGPRQPWGPSPCLAAPGQSRWQRWVLRDDATQAGTVSR
jgi:hypothetical protein